MSEHKQDAPIAEDLRPMFNIAKTCQFGSTPLTGNNVYLIECTSAAEQRERVLRDALLALAHEVFGCGDDSEPDVYADYDRLCELEKMVKAALAPEQPASSVVKNKTTPQGREFWDHVETIAEQVRAPEQPAEQGKEPQA